MDSVDATLGVTLTALLVFVPIAFEKAPTGTDKAISLFWFALVILIVGRAPFFIRAPEPNPTILAASSWAISMIPTTLARGSAGGDRSPACCSTCENAGSDAVQPRRRHAMRDAHRELAIPPEDRR